MTAEGQEEQPRSSSYRLMRARHCRSERAKAVFLLSAGLRRLISCVCPGRLSRDYEELPEVSEAMVTLAMIRLMVHRLAHPSRKRLPAP